jgi:phospholipid/cholesterol/gamma-HCH transport system permease protein
MIESVSAIGRGLMDSVGAFGAGAVMLLDALLGLFTKNSRAFKRIVDQMALVGIESLPIVLITMFFFGMVLGFQTSQIMVRYGAGAYVGMLVAVSIAREGGPTLAGIVVAARIGSSFAAELGSMKITNQIDAMRALATSPVRYLVTPRLIAAVIMVPLLTIFGDVIGTLGGAIVAVDAGIAQQTFFTSATQFLTIYDIRGGLIKAAVFGIIIAITSCRIGLNTEGGAAGVGKSTTAAVVWSIVLLYASNFLLTWLIYKGR